MKKIIILLTPIFCAVIVFIALQFILSRDTGKGALQVTSSPKSQVYLNGKLIGQTPLCKCEVQDMLTVGEYSLKLSPIDTSLSPFEQKIQINKSILTVVDRTFGSESSSEGSLITLKQAENSNNIELVVASFPDGADVFLDNNSVGKTPLFLKNITTSDHEIKLARTGYKEKVVRIHTVSGYQLLSTVYLGVDSQAQTPSLTPTSVASASATPTVAKVVILQTPTGFLRVRQDASVASAEIGRVNPNESYELLDEQQNWYKIKLSGGINGWVSSQYAQKQ